MTTNPPHTSGGKGTKPQAILLLGGPRSPAANALIDHLLELYIIPARLASLPEDARKPLRPTSAAKLRTALGALMADLMELHSNVGATERAPAGLHGLSPGDFGAKTLGFGRDIFLAVTAHMKSACLLEETTGKPRWLQAFGNHWVQGGTLTAYRLAPEALRIAEEYGVTVAKWSEHWRLVGEQRPVLPSSAKLLTLRKTREAINGKKQQAEDWPFDDTAPQVQAIIGGVEALNVHLGRQHIGGLAFLGLRRVFNNGEPGYAWNKGGRYYSLPGGHSYEGKSSEWRRSEITINGEAVDEVDLRASHLTLLHALLQKPFDPRQDPYEISGWPRAVVKAWVSQAIGASNPRPTQWSGDAQMQYEKERPGQRLKDEFAIREVGADVKARHPLLIDLKVCRIGTMDLMFHEAEILRLAMEDLILTQGITVLPMHDAIIAPKSTLRQAQEALERAFASHVEEVTGNPSMVIPKVTWKGQET